MSGALAGIGAATGAAKAVAGTIGGVAALAGALLGGYPIGAPGLGVWSYGMQTASWRGLPFGVRESAVRRGRKTALHEYPYRDDVWVEDLGRGTRITTLRGFILGDDVLLQHRAFIAASEQSGAGTLVHPALGARTATLVNFSATQRTETGRLFELEFEFVENSEVVFPTAVISTQANTATSAALAALATAAGYAARVAGAIAYGVAVVAATVSVVASWVSYAVSLASDASLAANALAGLPGNYGRYSQGSRATPLPTGTTSASVLASTISAVAAIQTQAAAATSTAAAGVSANTASAAASAASAVAAACSDPADQIRLLAALAVYQPPIPIYTDALGLLIVAAAEAAADMCRAQALVALGLATASYQPSSYNDAVTTRALVCGLLNDGALAAANVNDDHSYTGLHNLSTAVAADLSARGANLPPLVQFDFGTPLPSLVLAWRLYQDPTRADELANGAGAVNPGFVSSPFVALSA
jgi:prophage DNA circulation protein